jgi:hypothetical protein
MVAPPLLLRLPLHPVALQQPPLLLLRLVVPPRLRLQLLLLVEVRKAGYWCSRGVPASTSHSCKYGHTQWM